MFCFPFQWLPSCIINACTYINWNKHICYSAHSVIVFKDLFDQVIQRLYIDFQCSTVPGTGQKVCVGGCVNLFQCSAQVKLDNWICGFYSSGILYPVVYLGIQVVGRGVKVTRSVASGRSWWQEWLLESGQRCWTQNKL